MNREERLAIWERDRRICGICGEVVTIEHLEIDHILGTARGGTDAPDNLRATHRRCNRRKSILVDRRTRGRPPMTERRPLIQFRGDPVTLARLAALEAKLGINRTAVLQLAVARLAELEHVEGVRDG